MNPITFTIHGQAYSLKNSRQLVTLPSTTRADIHAIGIPCEKCRHQNRVIHVPGPKARKFETQFKKQLPDDAKQCLEMPVSVDIEIFYPSNLQDVDEAIVLDCMQRYGVIRNDRQIVAKWVVKRIDPLDPRVVVTVTPVAWERSGKQARLLDDEAERPAVGAIV